MISRSGFSFALDKARSDAKKTLGRLLILTVATTAISSVAGCGGGGGTLGGPVAGESSLTTVVVSSAANDRLVRFNMVLNSLTLTTKDGTSVSLISTPQSVEFMHLNSSAEPLVTLEVPQGVYTSATATVGGASFVCLTQQSGSDTISTYGATPDNQVTVQLPNQITVSGKSVALSLQLLVSQSATFPSNCWNSTGANPYSITPTFNLSAMALLADPTNATNGKMTALQGLVDATPGQNITIFAADGSPTLSSLYSSRTWQVSTNSSTVFQGIGNAQDLGPGMPVDLDGTLQANGTILATRIAVQDSDATDLTVNQGPLMIVSNAVPLLYQENQEEEGSVMYIAGWPQYNFSDTTFAVWGGLTNVASLPFAASFNASNMVAGQMVSITTHATEVVGNYLPATVETLMPQTINGTVMAMGTSGSFTTYTVQLAAYDVFPQFAIQGGQTTLLQNPQQVVIYADSSAQVLNTPVTGSPALFTGVIFNDNGTLRMDCTAIATGVTE